MSTEINIDPASPNFQTKLAEQIANIAPEVVADGRIDVDKLADLLEKDTPPPRERTLRTHLAGKA